MPYIFGHFDLKTTNLAGNYTEADRKLPDLIQSYWTHFAKTGNPNGPGLPIGRPLTSLASAIAVRSDLLAPCDRRPIKTPGQFPVRGRYFLSLAFWWTCYPVPR